MSKGYEITAIKIDRLWAEQIISHFIGEIREMEATSIDRLDQDKGYEFTMWSEDHQIEINLNVEYFSEYNDIENPDNYICLDRSVHTKLSMWNDDDGSVNFTVIGKLIYNKKQKHWQTLMPINIENKIIKEFQIRTDYE